MQENLLWGNNLAWFHFSNFCSIFTRYVFFLILICFWTLVSGLCAGKLIFSRQFRRRSHFKIVRNWDTLLLHKQTNIFGKNRFCFILTESAIEYNSMVRSTISLVSQMFFVVVWNRAWEPGRKYGIQYLFWFQNKIDPRSLHLCVSIWYWTKTNRRRKNLWEILQKPGGRSPWRFSCRSGVGEREKLNLLITASSLKHSHTPDISQYLSLLAIG